MEYVKTSNDTSSIAGGFAVFSDLKRRVCNILDFAANNLELVAKDGYIDPDNADENVRTEKVISETAFLLYVIASTIGTDIDIAKRIDQVASVLIPYARNEKTILEICVHPALALEYAQAHILLSKIGYPDSRLDGLLSNCIYAKSHLGRERPLHRILEQEWIKKNWRPELSESNFIDQVISYSCLNHPQDLLNASRDDMYALTHALMYVTDFNLSPYLLPRERSETLEEVEAFLASRLDEQDYDLAAELLLSWPMLGESWNLSSAFALKVLLKVEDEAGFLPSKSLRLGKLNKLENDDRKKYFFATTYHTMYVMGLLCALTIKLGESTSVHIKTPANGTARKMLVYLDFDGNPGPHWLQEFYKLSDTEQDSLSGLLFHIALQRYIRQKQYKVVHELLCIGYELGLANTALAAQIAELLERLSFLPIAENEISA